MLSTKRNYNKSVAPTPSPPPAGDGSLRGEQPPAEGRGRCIYRTAVTCGDGGVGRGGSECRWGAAAPCGVQQPPIGSSSPTGGPPVPLCPPVPGGRKQFGYCEQGGPGGEIGAERSNWCGPLLLGGSHAGAGEGTGPGGGGGERCHCPLHLQGSGMGGMLLETVPPPFYRAYESFFFLGGGALC